MTPPLIPLLIQQHEDEILETRGLLPEFKQNNVSNNSKRKRIVRERNVNARRRKNAYGSSVSSKRKVYVFYSESVRRKQRNVLSDVVVQYKAALLPILLLLSLEVAIQ